jgi:hypothetical protein
VSHLRQGHPDFHYTYSLFIRDLNLSTVCHANFICCIISDVLLQVLNPANYDHAKKVLKKVVLNPILTPYLNRVSRQQSQCVYLLSRAINFGRQCHFKIWLDCHKFKKIPCLIMPMSTKCQKNEKNMTINVIQHDDRL